MKILRNTLKEIIELMFVLPYAFFLLLNKRSCRSVVLYYHGVKKQDRRQFGRQMAYLSKKCDMAKVSEMKGPQRNHRKGQVAITFDDAFVSVMENALPVLKEYCLPAAVFVPTGNVGKKASWDLGDGNGFDHEMVMSESQLARLDDDDIEIFSHGISHDRLTVIDNDELNLELAQSKKYLERITGHNIAAISYPYGIYDDRVCQAARNLGYTLGFTIEPYAMESSLDDMQIGRFSVRAADSLLIFKLKVLGAYQATRSLRSMKALLFAKSKPRSNT